MKKKSKTSESGFNTMTDKKFACATLALCLMGGATQAVQASSSMGGG